LRYKGAAFVFSLSKSEAAADITRANLQELDRNPFEVKPRVQTIHPTSSTTILCAFALD